MYGCITSSLFTMDANIYKQINDQDETTNEITRRWVIDKNIKCLVHPIRESGGSTTSDNKTFNKEYDEELEVKMHTMEKISKRSRVSDIKNSQSNQYLYLEIDKISEPNTIFEVYSTHPVFDLFGNLQYYENHLRRTTTQKND